MTLLAKANPAVTDTLRLYEPSNGSYATGCVLHIANVTGTGATYSLYIVGPERSDDEYETLDALAVDVAIAANVSAKVEDFVVDAGSRLLVASGTADAVTFSLFGTEMPVGGV